VRAVEQCVHYLFTNSGAHVVAHADSIGRTIGVSLCCTIADAYGGTDSIAVWGSKRQPVLEAHGRTDGWTFDIAISEAYSRADR